MRLGNIQQCWATANWGDALLTGQTETKHQRFLKDGSGKRYCTGPGLLSFDPDCGYFLYSTYRYMYARIPHPRVK